MAIIKCPNCGNDISDKAEKCIHCGYELTKKVGNVCPECGAELEEGAKVCSKCGCPISPESSAAPQKVEVTSVSLKPKSKKPIIIGLLVVLALVGGFFVISGIQKQKAAEEAAAISADYEANLKSASVKMLTGAITAENCGNLIHDVWSNSIYEDRDSKTDKYTRRNNGSGSFYSDFNDALKNLFSDSSFQSDIDIIKSNQSEVADLMKKLSSPPEEWKEAHDAVKELYDAYLDLTGLAVSPTGSLQTFSSNFNNADSAVSNAYNKLKTYLE